MEDVALVTLTNDGYINFTSKCLLTLKHHGITDVIVYCLGAKCHKHFTELGYTCVSLDTTSDQSKQMQCFRNNNWHHVTIRKFDAIHENLQKYKYVCLFDGDIIFHSKLFIEYCLSNIGRRDLLIQSDRWNDKVKNLLCTGFMFIKSNTTTLDVFSPESALENLKLRKIPKGWDDQIYINNVRNKLKLKILPLDLFPNGGYMKHHSSKITNPMLRHYNFTRGRQKINTFNNAFASFETKYLK